VIRPKPLRELALAHAACCWRFRRAYWEQDARKLELREVAFGHPDPVERARARVQIEQAHRRANEAAAAMWAHQLAHSPVPSPPARGRRLR
jgi:hypothetical protein